MKFKEKLKRLKACQPAIDWVGDRTEQEAWEQCERGDWLLWWYANKYPDNIRELTLAKGHCANTVRYLMKDKRSRDAVDAAIAFGEGKITREELNDAAKGAATVADAAYNAADNAADNVFYAAFYAASCVSTSAAANAAYYAANAAYYAYYAYYDADDAYYAVYAASYVADAKEKENQKLTAYICRKYLQI